jgi:hypothetical protein
LEFNVTGGLSTDAVQLWSTDLRSKDRAGEFAHIDSVRPKNGKYKIRIEPGHIYTISSTTGQHKGDAESGANASTRMRLPYQENFEDAPVGGSAKFFSDVHGGFEIAPAGGNRTGKVYRQVVQQEPILWHRAKMPPTTIFGDPEWWGDYELSSDVLLEEPGYVELLGRIESQQHSAAGYHLRMNDNGEWSLYTENVGGHDRTLAVGTNAAARLNQWQRLTLRFHGEEITALLNDEPLTAVHDDSHSMGQVGLRVSPWQHAQFDNVRIVPTAAWPQFIPHSEMKVTATSEHSENDRGMIHIAWNAIDDRIETTWRPEYSPEAPLPQSLTLDLGRERSVGGLICRPSVALSIDGGGGFITDFNVALSMDGKTFTTVASGKWKENIAGKMVAWQEQTARYVRLEAKGSSSTSGVAVGELEVISGRPDATAKTAAR